MGLWLAFESAEFKELMFRDFIKTVTITSHHPQADGQIADMVEFTMVATKKVLKKLSNMIKQTSHHTAWPKRDIRSVVWPFVLHLMSWLHLHL